MQFHIDLMQFHLGCIEERSFVISGTQAAKFPSNRKPTIVCKDAAHAIWTAEVLFIRSARGKTAPSKENENVQLKLERPTWCQGSLRVFIAAKFLTGILIGHSALHTCAVPYSHPIALSSRHWNLDSLSCRRIDIWTSWYLLGLQNSAQVFIRPM